MKKVLASITLVIGLLALTACNAEEGDPKVIVKTTDGEITKEEFYEKLKDTPEAAAILQQLVTDMILEKKYEVTDADIDAEIADIRVGVEKDGTSFEDVLEAQGITEDVLRDTVKKSLLNQLLISDGRKITDEEIATFYESMKKQVSISHIQVDEEAEAKDLKAKLDAGEDFAKLAKEFSTDTSAEKGGDIGFISVDSSAGQDFINTAFNLKVDEISDVVKSDWGYHIIKVNEIKVSDDDIGTLEENKNFIKQKLIEQSVDQKQALERIENIYIDAKVEVLIDPFKDLFKKEEPEDEVNNDEGDKDKDKDVDTDKDKDKDKDNGNDKE